MPLTGSRTTVEVEGTLGTPAPPPTITTVEASPEDLKKYANTEAIETKVWDGSDGKWGVSVGFVITYDPRTLSIEEAAARSRGFLVLHHRATQDAYLEAQTQRR